MTLGMPLQLVAGNTCPGQAVGVPLAWGDVGTRRQRPLLVSPSSRVWHLAGAVLECSLTRYCLELGSGSWNSKR